jgi:hypothetical protein
MIETFQCTTLATSRYVVLGPLADSHFIPSKGICGLHLQGESVTSTLKIFLQNTGNQSKNIVMTQDIMN